MSTVNSPLISLTKSGSARVRIWEWQISGLPKIGSLSLSVSLLCSVFDFYTKANFTLQGRYREAKNSLTDTVTLVPSYCCAL